MADSATLLEREYCLLLVNADSLKALRLKRGLEQAKLAKKAGLSRRTIINIETGKTKPTQTTLRKIETALISEDSDLVEIVKTIWVDDMLEYFYCHFGFDKFGTAKKISNRLLECEVDSHRVCRGIVNLFGPWVDGFMPPNQTRKLRSGEAEYPYLMDLLLLSRVLNVRVHDLVKLDIDWKSRITKLKIALQKAQHAGIQWDLLLNTRMARLHKQERLAKIITVQPRDVEEALGHWLLMTDFSNEYYEQD